jgi:hypothetical protein
MADRKAEDSELNLYQELPKFNLFLFSVYFHVDLLVFFFFF